MTIIHCPMIAVDLPSDSAVIKVVKIFDGFFDV